MNRGLSVLWATDGSEECLASAGIIRALLMRAASRIHVLTVAPHAGSQFLLQNALSLSSKPNEEAMLEAGEAAEKAVQALRDAPAQIEKSVRWGIASREVIKAASEFQADIIVLGMKPHGLLRRLLLGDTGLQVLQATSSSVLLTKPFNEPELSDVVMLCLQAAHFPATVKLTENLSLAPNIRIHLTGFTEPPHLSPGVLPSYSDFERQQAAESREARRQALGAVFGEARRTLAMPGRRIDTLIAEDRLELGLKKLGDDLQPSVLITGATPFGNSLSSAVEAANVASLSSCSVLVVR